MQHCPAVLLASIRLHIGGQTFIVAPAAGVGAAGGAPNVALFNTAALNGRRDNRSLDWFATVRGRLGWAFDRLLVYGTGGVVFADRDNDRNNCFGCFNTVGVGSFPANFFVSTAAQQAAANVIAGA